MIGRREAARLVTCDSNVTATCRSFSGSGASGPTAVSRRTQESGIQPACRRHPGHRDRRPHQLRGPCQAAHADEEESPLVTAQHPDGADLWQREGEDIERRAPAEDSESPPHPGKSWRCVHARHSALRGYALHPQNHDRTAQRALGADLLCDTHPHGRPPQCDQKA
jgi:hypothetical protein